MKRTMTTLLLAACACAGAFQAAAFPAGSADAPGKDSLLVMFWNVENFFDYRSGSEYRPEYLTRRRFEAKCEAVCKTILAVSDRYGRYPDIVAFAEVESPSGDACPGRIHAAAQAGIRCGALRHSRPPRHRLRADLP